MTNTSGYSKDTQIAVIIDSVRHGVPRNIWIVVLKEKGAERYLPIQVNEAQADILAGQLRERPDKSIAPDLFLTSINATATHIKSVTIHLENNTFYAKLQLSRQDKPCEFRCPIGVALALSSRAKTPIVIDEAIWDQVAIVVNWDWPRGGSDSAIKAASVVQKRGIK